MKRWDLINQLIINNKYTTYLEIGVRDGKCFEKINIKTKHGVDPDPRVAVTFKTTSDNFFKTNKNFYDIIFIDGLHLKEQIRKDIDNSLKFLNTGGAIVCHDINPIKESQQIREYDGKSSWNGDVWKEWVRLRSSRKDLSMSVIDTDCGLGVIQRGNQDTINLPENLDFSYLSNNRKKCLNLITVKEWVLKNNNE